MAVIVGSLAFPAFAEATQTAEDPASSVASQDSVPTSSAPPPSSEPAPVPSESVSSSTEPEEPSSVYEEPSSQYYEEPSSVYEEPSSQYYEEPSSDDYGYNYEDSSTYTDSAITGSLLPETSADGASGTTSHNWDKLLENINSANAAGMEDGTFVFKDDPDNTNNTGANDGGWILWTGIGFIFLAVCGISYVIYANFFSKKCPRKRLAAAQAAQRARIQSSSAKRQVSQQQTLSSAKGRPDSSSSAYGDGYITPLKNRLLHKRARLPDRPLRLGVTSLPIRLKGLPSPGNISVPKATMIFGINFLINKPSDKNR